MWNKPLLLKEISERWLLPVELNLINDYESHLYFLLENMMVQSKQHVSDCSGTKTGTKIQGPSDKWVITLAPMWSIRWWMNITLTTNSPKPGYADSIGTTSMRRAHPPYPSTMGVTWVCYPGKFIIALNNSAEKLC